MAEQLPKKHVVTCFLKCGDRILILRRSQKVSSFKGRWGGVSGYVESSADEQSLVEVREETGLCPDHILLIKKGELLEVDDPETGVRWVVHPYLYRIEDKDSVKLDWEHSECRWIAPGELSSFHTVPMLRETLEKVYPP